ncbi:nitroreductase family protein [Methylobacterium nodulans]|uniref:nitroreductase family protein n=1 Tax=Methylobacterium nodulans TaxID=114616 RepID=UPI003CC71826
MEGSHGRDGSTHGGAGGALRTGGSEPRHRLERHPGLLAHRSVRAYRPDPPPAGTLETLIAAAQWPPPRTSRPGAWSQWSIRRRSAASPR